MKKILLICTTFFIVNSFAQQSTFIFTKERSEQLKNVYHTPTVYAVKKTQIPVSKFDTIKKITKEYAEYEIENQEYINDSLLSIEKFNKAKITQKTLNSISDNLKLYLNSTNKYKEKKLFLITAQKSADSLSNANVLYAMVPHKMIKPAIKNVIYADNDINPNFKKDFKDINSNETIFNEHITSIINRIASLPYPQFNWKRQNRYSKSIGNNNGKINKYDLEFKPSESVNIDGFLVEKEVDYLSLVGTFIKIDTILSKRGTTEFLILKSNLKGFNIELNKFKETSDFIIQNIETKEYFLAYNGLLKTYAIDNELFEICEKLNKKGFTTKQIGEHICIILEKQNIKLDDKIKEEVKKDNFNFITNLSKSIDRYTNLANQSKPIFERLSNHISSYEYRTLTTERLAIWKQDNLKGQDIIKQFELLHKSQNDIYYLDANVVGVENVQNYINISNAVLVSNKFIGM